MNLTGCPADSAQIFEGSIRKVVVVQYTDEPLSYGTGLLPL